jgi:hypothetical protein
LALAGSAVDELNQRALRCVRTLATASVGVEYLGCITTYSLEAAAGTCIVHYHIGGETFAAAGSKVENRKAEAWYPPTLALASLITEEPTRGASRVRRTLTVARGCVEDLMRSALEITLALALTSLSVLDQVIRTKGENAFAFASI